ncbi:MAG: signal recognition particle subunit SRP19/SEC65 family protein [Euryarchaeota archaeon]|nr:signal recognition particle subunit SRP19/SEC65 family protein [Euryarchaeota archaeon]
MNKERILYPCYFDFGLKRSEGRRVPLKIAVEKPSSRDVEKAAKRCDLKVRSENQNHPAHTSRRDGRIVVAWDESKEELLRKVAGNLKQAK